MARSQNLNNLEKDKFRDGPNGSSKVAVSLEGDTGLLQGIEYDDIQQTEPTATTENYSYYKSAALVATIEVTYFDSTKARLTRVRRI